MQEQKRKTDKISGFFSGRILPLKNYNKTPKTKYKNRWCLNLLKSKSENKIMDLNLLCSFQKWL